MDEPASPNSHTPQDALSSVINTHGGAFVEGNINVEPGGIFVGRDYVTYIIQQAQAYKFETLHELRTIRDTFTGRTDEIAQLIALARSERGSAAMTICSSVTGMGGVGKSELANVVAHALSADYPDAQLWLELGAHSIKPATPQQALERVLHTWLPEAKLPDDLAALQGLYRQQLSGKRALVVLDDVANDDDLAVLLPPAGCLILATSRRALATGTALRLDTLQPADSVALLRRFRSTLSDAEANALAELCGHLPVALTVAGSYLKQNVTVTAERYLAALHATPFETLRFGGDEKNDVGRVFTHSVNELSETERMAWCALSVMPADFDRAAGVAVSGVADALDHPLDVLVRLNLLEYAAQAERFSWHDLLQQFARRLMNGFMENGLTEYAARERHIAHYTQVAESTRNLYLDGQQRTSLEIFDRERSHIETAFIVLTNLADPISNSAARIVNLVIAVANTGQSMRFHPRQRVIWLQAQARAAQEIGDRYYEANALGNLGNAYSYMSDVQKAIKSYEQALFITREIGDQNGEGVHTGNLGSLLAELGESHKAIDMYEKRLIIARITNDRRGEVITLGNLGDVYADLGKMRQGITFQEQALLIAREYRYRRDEAAVLIDLGKAYAKLDETHKAIGFLNQALDIAYELGYQRSVEDALNNLGFAYSDLGEASKAIDLHSQALIIAEELDDHHEQGIALSGLGRASDLLGETQKAVEFYEQALNLFHIHGYRRDEAYTRWGLGLHYEVRGNLRRAIELMQVLVDYETEIGHCDVEAHRVYVEQLRARLNP